MWTRRCQMFPSRTGSHRVTAPPSAPCRVFQQVPDAGAPARRAGTQGGRRTPFDVEPFEDGGLRYPGLAKAVGHEATREPGREADVLVDSVDRGKPLRRIEPDSSTTLAAGGSRIEVEEQPVRVRRALTNGHWSPRRGRSRSGCRPPRPGCTVVSLGKAPAIAADEVVVVRLDLRYCTARRSLDRWDSCRPAATARRGRSARMRAGRRTEG